MFTNKQQEPPTDKQLAFINGLERKTGLIFYGTTKVQAIKFIEKANRMLEDVKSIKRKIERENERFPFPDLSKELPTSKQWSYIGFLEKETHVQFQGVTKNDAIIYIDYAQQLLKNK